MSGAWIGGETESWLIALCSYSPAPGEPHCARDATWHGIEEAEPDLIGMACCDGHLSIMRTLADYVHPLVHPCEIPGAEFRPPENKCFTEWNEQSEFSQVAESAGAA
ncbi:MAG: hypothetical protein ACRDVE_02535 [Actinocrinis sp.]